MHTNFELIVAFVVHIAASIVAVKQMFAIKAFLGGCGFFAYSWKLPAHN